jgi:TolB-like protein/DNA-binding winged helix-turn-helix (wHTH) protein/Tfp pilus assembly protein PilF
VSGDRIVLFESTVLDLARGSLLRAEEPVHLRPQSYEVLLYLAENKGRLVGKNELLDAVWEGRAVTDGSLGKCIEEVREALGDLGRRHLRNVRGRGYIFDPEPLMDGNGAPGSPRSPVAEVTAPQPAGAVADTAARRPPLAAARRRRLMLPAAAAVLVLVAAGFLHSRSAGRGATMTSVVVLPFTNAANDPELEHLCDGLSEGLINALSELRSLKVVARYSAFAYKARQPEIDVVEVGRALGVEAVLIGRVDQRDDDLLVAVELIDAHDRTRLWGEQYIRGASDLQAVQREMTRTVSEKLRLHLSPAQEQRLDRQDTGNAQAYQFYLNGLFHLRKGSLANVSRALDYYQQAVALDPGFALAWVGVANAERYFGGNSLLDPEEPIFRARVAVERALELDDTLAEAHVVLAGIERDAWNWAAAEREYRKALELNPSLADAHAAYSNHLSLMGRPDQALAEIRRAQDLDPLRTDWRRREAWVLLLAGRKEAALQIERALAPELDANPYSSGLMKAGTGRYEEAVDLYRESLATRGESTSTLCYLGYALAQVGERGEALALLDRLEITQQYVSPVELAVLYAGVDDKEGALASLEKAYAAHDLQIQTLLVEPHLDGLRSDPRFQDLLRRVGLS